MKTLVKSAVGLAAAYVLIMLITGLAIKTMVSGSAGDTIRSQLESYVPVPVSFGDGDFDLTQWFLFQPAISLADISIRNPKGFSDRPLLEASEVSTQVALLSLFSDRVEIRAVTLREPILNVERNRQGKTNLEALLALISKSPAGQQSAASEESGSTQLAVGGFFLDQGTIRYTDAATSAGGAGLLIDDIDLRVLDFAPDATCKLTFQASFFGGVGSGVRFEGRGGPFKSQSLPAQGNLSIEIAPAEIPPALREEYFGELLRDPPSDSRVVLETDMQGDLMKVFKGHGKLMLSDFEVGRDAENRLPLNGEAPLDLTAQRLMTNPALDLVIPNGSLTLGKGTWSGRAELSYARSRVRGASSGKISDVDINEMMSSLTSAEDKVSGKAAIPEYSLRFAGTDADQIRNSLAGTGSLTLEEGNIGAFNLLGTIQKHADKLLGGDSSEPGETEFTRLSSNVEIKGGQVHLTNIVIESPAFDVAGDGYFTFEKELHFDLQTSVEGALAASLGGRPDSAGNTTTTVPVRVRGTVDSPKVYPDVKCIAIDKAKGLLDSLFKKRE